ncbi:hypothetical protein TWF730_003572 [Orbilia blumenaviensis]|uniref:Uncharacterized protein n=1 Tax=Orbilia blumenaviensis TaxID=1796055 RepID=A0AAV9U428_9PEZI
MAERGPDPEDINGDGIKDVWIDTDGDGIPDAIDFDANGFQDGDLLDINSDGIPDAIRVYGLTNLMYLAFTRSADLRTTLVTSTIDRSTTTTTTTPISQQLGPSEAAITSEPAVADTLTIGPTSTPNTPVSSVTSSAAGPSETAISSSSNSKVPVGAIVGGAIGGLVVILLIALVILGIMRERRKLAQLEQARDIVGGNEGHETTKK